MLIITPSAVGRLQQERALIRLARALTNRLVICRIGLLGWQGFRRSRLCAVRGTSRLPQTRLPRETASAGARSSATTTTTANRPRRRPPRKRGRARDERGAVRAHQHRWRQRWLGECPTGSKAGGPGLSAYILTARKRCENGGEGFGPVAVRAASEVTLRARSRTAPTVLLARARDRWRTAFRAEQNRGYTCRTSA